jgi:hypothetical protein
VSFKPSPITISDILTAEKGKYEGESKDSYKIYEDAEGKVAIYHEQPLDLVPEGKLMDLDNMIVKIADFGQGLD